MALPSNLAKQLEEQGRYVLAAGLAEGRRVLDISRGYATGLVALAEAGASGLHAHVSNPSELNAALDEVGLEGTQVAQDVGLPLPYADGMFDLVIVHDLADRLAKDSRWESELRRVLGEDGYLITAVANPAGQFISEIAGERFESPIAYEALVGRISPHFSAVSAFGQSPLAASLFFDFADTSEETGLTLDRSLLPDADEQPGWFVVVFGPEEYHRDDLNIVQLPFDTLVSAGGGRVAAEEGALEEEGAEEEVDTLVNRATASGEEAVALEHAERLIQSLERDLAMARAQVVAADAWVHARPKDNSAAEAAQAQAQNTIAKLERQLVSSQDVVVHLEMDLAEARRLHKEAQSAATQVEDLQQHVKALEAQLSQHEALQLRVQTLEAESTVMRQSQERLAEVDQELARSRHDRASFEAQIADLMEEVAALRRGEETLTTELQGARDRLQTQAAQAAHDKAHLEHEQARLTAEVAQARQASLAPLASQANLHKQHDAVGRELDTAVEELEDLLKDVAPPISSGR